MIIDKKVLAIGIDNEMLAYESRKGLVIADKNGHIRKNIKTEICPCNAVALRDGGYYIVGKEDQGDLFTSIWYLSNEYELSRKADGLKKCVFIGVKWQQ